MKNMALEKHEFSLNRFFLISKPLVKFAVAHNFRKLQSSENYNRPISGGSKIKAFTFYFNFLLEKVLIQDKVRNNEVVSIHVNANFCSRLSNTSVKYIFQ